jgi:hypothetical protein
MARAALTLICAYACEVVLAKYVNKEMPEYAAVSDQTKGLVLAMSSSAFIGASFIIKKKGLRRAGSGGMRAGSGGFGYLKQPLWWTGMVLMIVGEAANFAAYAYAPPVLVTPLGALSIIVSALLAHTFLAEKLNLFGVIGCILCVAGSTVVVIHAPSEPPIHNIQEIGVMAQKPAFLVYSFFALATSAYLVWRVAPTFGHTNIFINLSICSLMGSLSVMSCKALGIAVRLSLRGYNQFIYSETHLCLFVVIVCVLTQMNYLNKALDMFNTAIVSPIYYVMFTTLTIVASATMMDSFNEQTSGAPIACAVASEMCGFIVILCGTALLHLTKDFDVSINSLLGGMQMHKTSSEVRLHSISMEGVVCEPPMTEMQRPPSEDLARSE